MHGNEHGLAVLARRESLARPAVSAPVLLLVVGLVLITFGISYFATLSSVAHRQEAIFDEYLSKVDFAALQPGFPELRKRLILSLGIYNGRDTAIVSGAAGVICLVVAYCLSRRRDDPPQDVCEK